MQKNTIQRGRKDKGIVMTCWYCRNIDCRYITAPLLLEDRKFDIRCYLMIVSTMPYLVLFAPGYVRLSLRKYSLSDTNLITHLTNQVGKGHFYHFIANQYVPIITLYLSVITRSC